MPHTYLRLIPVSDATQSWQQSTVQRRISGHYTQCCRRSHCIKTAVLLPTVWQTQTNTSRSIIFSDGILIATTRAANWDLEQRRESDLARQGVDLNILAGVNQKVQQSHDNVSSSSIEWLRVTLLAFECTEAFLPVSPPRELVISIGDEKQANKDIYNDLH